MTEREIKALTMAMEKDNQNKLGADGPVEAWIPWWEQPETYDIVLNETGMALIDAGESAEDIDEGMGMPHLPRVPLPAFSTMTSREPSKSMPVDLMEIIYYYCLVMRIYNGDLTADVFEATQFLLRHSRVLGMSQSFVGYDVKSAFEEILIDSGNQGSTIPTNIPTGMRLGVMKDVVHVLELGRVGMILALTDLSRLCDLTRKELKNESDSRDMYNSLKKQILQVSRKLLFFLSWVNENGNAIQRILIPDLQIAYDKHIDIHKQLESKDVVLPKS